MLDRFAPGLVEHMTENRFQATELLVGVDEQTAMVGDGERWQVIGRGGVHLRVGRTGRGYVTAALSSRVTACSSLRRTRRTE